MEKSKKQPNNPMQPAILANAPRCGARTRAGAPCRSPAVGGAGRCRMHGGKGSGAPRGNRNAWKHGVRSAEYAKIVRELRAIEQGGDVPSSVIPALSRDPAALAVAKKKLDPGSSPG